MSKKYICPYCAKIQSPQGSNLVWIKCCNCTGEFLLPDAKTAKEVKDTCEIPAGPYSISNTYKIKSRDGSTVADIPPQFAYDMGPITRLLATSWDMWQLMKRLDKNLSQISQKLDTNGPTHRTIKGILSKIEGGEE